jgi:hypothetical protein
MQAQSIQPASEKVEQKSLAELQYQARVENLIKMKSDQKVIDTLNELMGMGFLDYDKNFKLCMTYKCDVNQVVNNLC